MILVRFAKKEAKDMIEENLSNLIDLYPTITQELFILDESALPI